MINRKNAASALLFGSTCLTPEVISGALPLPSLLIGAFGLYKFARGFHTYTLTDEKALELQFSDEYTKYKESTPRYIPSFKKIIKSIIK